MNSTCTSVRVPYSTWRLQVLRRLCSTADYNSGPTLPFLHPRSADGCRRDRREFHGSPVRTRSNFKDVKRTEKYKAALREQEVRDASDTLEGAARKAAVPDWNPYTEESISEMQDLVGRLRDMAKDAKEKGAKGDNDTPFLGTRVFKRPSKTDPESPFGDWAPWRRDKGERESEIQLDSRSEKSIWAPVLAKPPLPERGFKHPQSPFEGTRKSKWQREKKAQVSEVEIDQGLENNIWAQILATSTRLDKGTKARLPTALMVDWGPMRHPESGEDYFLPIELSDLEGLRQELEQAKKSSGDQTPHDREHSEQKIGHTKPGLRARVRMSADRLLVQAVTDSLTHVMPIRGVPGGTRYTTTKKVFGLLIPYRWKHKQNEFQSFQRTRQRFNEALGREPDTDERDVEEMTKLEDLQWQGDIAERMEKIMRSRVLITLEAVARDNVSTGAVSDRMISTLPVPKTGRLHITDGEKVVENEIPDATEVGQRPETTPNWVHGAISLHIGDPKLFRTTVENWHRLNGGEHPADKAALEKLPSHNLLPPTITINNRFRLPVFNLESLFGEENATTAQQVVTTNKIFAPEFWSQRSEEIGTSSESSDSEPNTSSTESVTSNPVLDAGGQVLSSILTPSVNTNEDTNIDANTEPPVDSPPMKENTNATSQPPPLPPSPPRKSPPEEYLILIKPHTMHALAIAREIWQLWRYIGGRKGLYLGDHIGVDIDVDAHEKKTRTRTTTPKPGVPESGRVSA